jgi:SanA protein
VLFWGVLLVASNVWIVLSTSSQVFEGIDEAPFNEVGLVLGTSSKTMSGIDNPYFVTRIEQAAALYKAGKVNHLIVSGDNETVYYNEPEKMKQALIENGVPASAITLDLSGFRTLDSIVRCKYVFGINSVTIITQKFHGYRALFLCNYNDLEAIVVTTQSLHDKGSLSVLLREYLARFKAVLDLYILHTVPKKIDRKEVLPV